eukprot:scaffold596_cov95-Isochrysis_galbana.AAC.1
MGRGRPRPKIACRPCPKTACRPLGQQRLSFFGAMGSLDLLGLRWHHIRRRRCGRHSLRGRLPRSLDRRRSQPARHRPAPAAGCRAGPVGRSGSKTGDESQLGEGEDEAEGVGSPDEGIVDDECSVRGP